MPKFIHTVQVFVLENFELDIADLSPTQSYTIFGEFWGTLGKLTHFGKALETTDDSPWYENRA